VTKWFAYGKNSDWHRFRGPALRSKRPPDRARKQEIDRKVRRRLHSRNKPELDGKGIGGTILFSLRAHSPFISFYPKCETFRSYAENRENPQLFAYAYRLLQTLANGHRIAFDVVKTKVFEFFRYR
jgi:hypothetical protein